MNGFPYLRHTDNRLFFGNAGVVEIGVGALQNLLARGADPARRLLIGGQTVEVGSVPDRRESLPDGGGTIENKRRKRLPAPSLLERRPGLLMTAESEEVCMEGLLVHSSPRRPSDKRPGSGSFFFTTSMESSKIRCASGSFSPVASTTRKRKGSS